MIDVPRGTSPMSIESQFEKLAQKLRTKSPVPIRLQLWNGAQIDLADFALREPLAKIILPTRDAMRYMVSPSLSNLGRAYVEGAIDIEGRLGDVIEASWTLARSAVQPHGRLGRLFRFWTHTRDSDRKDIEYHYDVSNDFYKLWLDENMVYSCAYFADGTEDLATAQIKKIDHILTKLQLQPGERLLDIGCGWGALAIRAAQQFGADVRGITLSKQQHAHATQRVRELGLEDKVTIELRDYRDLLPEFEGHFDKVSSVGMFEHVGFKGLEQYFSIMRAVTRDGGLMLNHGITTSDPENGETPYGGTALRCDLTGLQLAGFLHDEDEAKMRLPQTGIVWLRTVLPDAPPLPVRMSFTHPHVGVLTAMLVGAHR